ncbi:hypothetical protein [Mangrovicoccus sp. HB161399]|uniref:hypothetical protein n=1 Tax=Mangrovicoccus sp. HB161399 TaxID=2720392 RepID=UPI0015580A38|nr:hypothetical protein [Mangrovicoccus sp. HB161399]
MIRFLACGALYAFPMAAQAQDSCPCYPFPYEPDPPCVEICVPSLLGNVPTEALADVLDLPAFAWAEIAVRQQAGNVPETLEDGYAGDVAAAIRAALKRADPAEVNALLEEFVVK